MDETRKNIIRNFAFWAAQRAIKYDKNMKKKPKLGKKLFKALSEDDQLKAYLEELYSKEDNELSQDYFNEWHKKALKTIQKHVYSFGWAAKLLNLILKVEVYIGELGSANLISLIHPPLDNILVNKIVRKLGKPKKYLITKIKKALPIREVKPNIYYNEIIPALKDASEELDCSYMIELEKLWNLKKIIT